MQKWEKCLHSERDRLLLKQLKIFGFSKLVIFENKRKKSKHTKFEQHSII